MYIGIDVGATKTLVALFDTNGQIVGKERFETPKKYPAFLVKLDFVVGQLSTDRKILAVCCGLPAIIDRQRGVARNFGNLGWHNTPIKDDLKSILPRTKIFLENDANLAGLSEAHLVHNRYKKVLYLTISTGIGDSIIVNGVIDPIFADSESGHMILEYDGKLQKWEDFASGAAIKQATGKLAEDINDEHFWHKYVKGLAKGIDVLVATLLPEVIIVGGGVGAHFDKFGHFLIHELSKYENNMVKMPPVIQAKRPEEAVIYGCYEFIRQTLKESP